MNQSTHLTFRSRVIERFPLLSCSNAPPHSVWPGGPFCRPDARNMSPSRRERKRKETRVKDGRRKKKKREAKNLKILYFLIWPQMAVLSKSETNHTCWYLNFDHVCTVVCHLRSHSWSCNYSSELNYFNPAKGERVR